MVKTNSGDLRGVVVIFIVTTAIAVAAAAMTVRASRGQTVESPKFDDCTKVCADQRFMPSTLKPLCGACQPGLVIVCRPASRSQCRTMTPADAAKFYAEK